MAKRPSARRASDADDVDDDDGYAWESPKKKDGLKKSATGRAKSKRPSADAEEVEEEEEEAPKPSRGSSAKRAGKTSGSAKLGKSGSTRLEGSSRNKKSGSTRRASSSDEDDEGSTSGRRRRAAPAKKKQDNTILLISIATITLLLIGGLVLRGQIRQPVDAPNHQNELERILAMGKEGEQAFRAWNKAKQGKGGNEQQAYHECTSKLQKAVEDMTRLLSQPPYCDAEGNTKPEYEGYEPYMQKWAELLVDVEKGSTLHGG